MENEEIKDILENTDQIAVSEFGKVEDAQINKSENVQIVGEQKENLLKDEAQPNEGLNQHNDIKKNESDVAEKKLVAELEPFFEDESEKNKHYKMLTFKRISSALGNMSIVLVSMFLIVFMAQLLATLGAFLIAFLLGAILFLLSIATLGLIYLTGVMGDWWAAVGKIMQGGADFTNFLTKFYVALPFAIALSFIFSIVSIILQYRCGPYKSKARVVISIISAVVGLFLIIMMIAGVAYNA